MNNGIRYANDRRAFIQLRDTNDFDESKSRLSNIYFISFNQLTHGSIKNARHIYSLKNFIVSDAISQFGQTLVQYAVSWISFSLSLSISISDPILLRGFFFSPWTSVLLLCLLLRHSFFFCVLLFCYRGLYKAGENESLANRLRILHIVHYNAQNKLAFIQCISFLSIGFLPLKSILLHFVSLFFQCDCE